MSHRRLPGVVITKLNELGFVLVDGEAPYTLQRLSVAGELRLRVQPIPTGKWRVQIEAAVSGEGARLLPSFSSLIPSRYGLAVDGATLEVSDGELGDQLPSMLAAAVLPTWDSPCHEG